MARRLRARPESRYLEPGDDGSGPTGAAGIVQGQDGWEQVDEPGRVCQGVASCDVGRCAQAW